MTVREALKEATCRLEAAGVPDARLDAGWLLEEVSKIPRLEQFTRGDFLLGEGTQARFFALVARREKREPLQYILSRAPFMGHEFAVRPGVLIPRADTEVLCERAVIRLPQGGRALDLCCGTGCLGVSLKLARPDAEVTLSDLSRGAAALARENAALLGADARVLQGDLFESLQGRVFDLILSNPPYIPSPVLPGLQPEVLREPALALDGGADGLAFYRRILREAKRHLSPGGWLLLELGDGEAQAAGALVPEEFERPIVYPDLAGRPRVLETRLRSGVH